MRIRWNVWGAAYLINGGCSDDGFEYFRGWLIGQGEDTFNRALADPDSLADLQGLDGDVEREDMLYVALHAYRGAVGDELPREAWQYPELGDDWDFDDDEEMERRYPKLFAKFCAD